MTPTDRPRIPRDGQGFLAGLRGRSPHEQLEDPSPRRVAALLSVLADPQRCYRAIHVTGTNGKGSVAAMTAQLLRQQGLRVGLYTGPHLSRINERITIAGQEVGDSALEQAVGQVRRAARECGMTPGWFEAVTAAALWLFAAQRVDVAVIEVGMLGRFDATNVLSAPVAVVTNVARDHDAEAGGGRHAIAAEKAQIVHPGSTLVLGEPDPWLRPVFEERDPARILTQGLELYWADRRPGPCGSRVDLTNPWGRRRGVHVGMLGAHQCDNAALALTAAEAFLERAIPHTAVDAGLARARVPGRFEIRHRAPLVVLDGAHNAAAAVALRRAVREISAGMTPRALVYGVREGRDPATFLRQCGVEHVDRIFVTEVEPGSTAPLLAAAAAEEFGAEVAVVEDPVIALRSAVRAVGPDGLVVATGSLRLVGQLREVRLLRRATAQRRAVTAGSGAGR
jgi:dihydrofolate synthase/folylpolyglutamate synthase